MRVALVSCGTRGDVQPMAALKLLGWLSARFVNAGVLSAVNRGRSELGLRPIDDVLENSSGPSSRLACSGGEGR